MVKVLFVHGNILQLGGTESFMMNYYREFDPSKIHVDFLVHGMGRGVYDREVLSKGSEIYHAPIKSKHPIQNLWIVNKVIKRGKYDVVHAHMDAANCIPLLIARIHGVKVRISHVHSTQCSAEKKTQIIVNVFMRKLLKHVATDFFACSKSAADWLYQGIDIEKIKVIPNAINTDRFAFQIDNRKRIRDLFQIPNDSLLVGHIGRFDNIKNQEFIVELADRFQKKNSDVRFMLVGGGERKGVIEDEIERRGLENVLLAGNTVTPEDFYSAFDLFILPSKWEGFPVTLVEATANGLACVVSDKVSKEVDFAGNIDLIDINDVEQWLRVIEQKRNVKRKNYYCQMNKAGFDIKKNARYLVNIYQHA